MVVDPEDVTIDSNIMSIVAWPINCISGAKFTCFFTGPRVVVPCVLSSLPTLDPKKFLKPKNPKP